MVASLVLAATLFAADLTPGIDCSKVRWFVQTYGESRAMDIGRKNFGYSEEAIRWVAKKCLGRRIG